MYNFPNIPINRAIPERNEMQRIAVIYSTEYFNTPGKETVENSIMVNLKSDEWCTRSQTSIVLWNIEVLKLPFSNCINWVDFCISGYYHSDTGWPWQWLYKRQGELLIWTDTAFGSWSFSVHFSKCVGYYVSEIWTDSLGNETYIKKIFVFFLRGNVTCYVSYEDLF